jgi:hypothetical protein
LATLATTPAEPDEQPDTTSTPLQVPNDPPTPLVPDHESEDRTCVQCHGAPDGKERRVRVGDGTVWLHPECERFFRHDRGERHCMRCRLPGTDELDVEIRTEMIVSSVVENTQRPHPELPLDADGIACLKQACTVILRLYGLPAPSDDDLNELVRDMCDWHHIPVSA